MSYYLISPCIVLHLLSEIFGLGAFLIFAAFAVPTVAGRRLVVPTDAPNWHWVSGGGRRLSSLAQHTAHLVRDMAEGEENPTVPERSPLQTGLSILGILFSLQIFFSILALLTSALFG